MKKTKLVLKGWGKEIFGDIFKKLKIREDIVRVKKELFKEYPITANRVVLQKAQAEFKQYL